METIPSSLISAQIIQLRLNSLWTLYSKTLSQGAWNHDIISETAISYIFDIFRAEIHEGIPDQTVLCI